MNNNLVLTAAIGYSFEQIELFIKTLRKFYSGSITFLIGEKDYDLEGKLNKFGCETIKTNTDKKEIQFKRYLIFLKYLRGKSYKNIFLCDSRDIYFQSDPFEFNYEGQINFFLEDKKIKDCPFNTNWIVKTYGQNEFTNISNKIILCSGTVLGNNSKILEYLNLITHCVSTYKYKKKFRYLITLRPDPEGRGCDQGHANFIVHNSKIKNFKLYTNGEGPVATAFYLKQIVFDENFKLINDKGEPYKIVHQYDKRWDEFKNSVEKFKSNLNI